MDTASINPFYSDIISAAMIEPVYSEKVDLRSREAMTAFLSAHATHDGSYSHNVKLRNMPIPSHLEDEMSAIISSEEYGDGLFLYEAASARFTQEHPHLAYELSGRSNGHLELRSRQRTYNDRADTVRTQAYPYRATAADDLADLDMQDLRDLTRDVMTFDAAADQLRAAFIALASGRINARLAEAAELSTPAP